MMVQVHIISKEGQMTRPKETHLENLIPCWCTLERLMRSSTSMKRTTLKAKMGSWRPYPKAVCPSDALTFAPIAIASAALPWVSETVPTMRNYRAGKPTTGGTPDSKLREDFREKLPKSGGAFFTPEQRHILELFGVIGEILEQVHTKSFKRRKVNYEA